MMDTVDENGLFHGNLPLSSFSVIWASRMTEDLNK